MRLYALLILLLSTATPCQINHAYAATSDNRDNHLQSTLWSCGPAALRKLLSEFGISATESELIDATSANPVRGTTLINLKLAAEKYGFVAKGQEWNLNKLKQITNPVIAHLNDNHYVVIYRANDESISLFDPMIGKQELPTNQFSNLWKGVILYIEKSSDNEIDYTLLSHSQKTLLTLENALHSALTSSSDIKRSIQVLEENRSLLDQTYSLYTIKESINASTYRSANISNTIDAYEDQQQIQYGIRDESLSNKKLGGTFSTELKFGLSSLSNEQLGSDTRTYSAGPEISLTYKQPLSKSGRIANHGTVSIAKNQWQQALLQHEIDREQTIYQTILSFYDLAKAKQLIQLTYENSEQTLKQLEHAKIQSRLGNIAEIEVSKIEVQLSRDKNNLLIAESDFQSRYETFLTQIGMSGSFDIDVKQGGISIDEIKLNHKKAMDIALKNRKDLHRIDYTQGSLLTSLEQFKSQDDSTLTLTANYQKNSKTSQRSELLNGLDNESWQVMASFEYPFNDHGVTNSQTQQIRSQLFQNEIDRQQLLDRINNEISESIRNLDSSLKTYEILDRATKLAEENLKIDQLRFNKGVISSDDLHRTQIDLLQLKVDSYNSLIDYELAKASLYKAIGQLQTIYM